MIQGMQTLLDVVALVLFNNGNGSIRPYATIGWLTETSLVAHMEPGGVSSADAS